METTNQTEPGTAPEQAAQPAAETPAPEKTDKPAPETGFTDIEAEISSLKPPKQVYEKALNTPEEEPEATTEEESEEEETVPDGKKVKKKVIDSEFVDEGAEMIFNVSDFAFSSVN